MLGKKSFLIGCFLSLLTTWQLLNAHPVAAADPKPLIQTKHVYQERDGKKCSFTNGCVEAGAPLNVSLDGISFNDGTPFPDGKPVGVRLIGQGSCTDWPDLLGPAWVEEGNCNLVSIDSVKRMYCNVSNGKLDIKIKGDQIKSNCSYSVEVHLSNDYHPNDNWKGDGAKNNTMIISKSIPVGVLCSEEQCNEDLDANSSYELCKQINTNTPQYQACTDCFAGNGVWTAVGCIPSDPQSVIKVVVTIGLGLGGGVVLIMILVGAAMLSVSQGDPNKTKEAQEMITSAIIGLVFVIFSVTILQFIGVSVLRIPGFGG